MSKATFETNSQLWLTHFDTLVLDNLTNPYFSNAWLASQLFVSERKLYRLIRQHTNQSPNHYIRSLRLTTAYHLLESGLHNTVKEVALIVGFQKPKYFAKVFRAKYGINPVAILQNNKLK